MRDPRDYLSTGMPLMQIVRAPPPAPVCYDTLTTAHFRTSVKCSSESVRRLLHVFVAIRPPFG
jgi:hypothetical protein